MDFSYITNLFAIIPIDWTLIGSFAILAAFDTLKNGARRACTVALTLPVTALLVSMLSKAEILGQILEQYSTPIFSAALFGIIFIGIYALITRFGLSWGDDAGQAIHAALAGVAVTVILVTMWVGTPSLDALWHFGEPVQYVFGDSFRFFWLLGAYAALAFARS